MWGSVVGRFELSIQTIYAAAFPITAAYHREPGDDLRPSSDAHLLSKPIFVIVCPACI